MNLKGMQTIHTETINGVRYTTVSYFNGDVDGKPEQLLSLL